MCIFHETKKFRLFDNSHDEKKRVKGQFRNVIDNRNRNQLFSNFILIKNDDNVRLWLFD